MGRSTNHFQRYKYQQWVSKRTYRTWFLYWQTLNLNTGRLKPIISPFITGYYFLHYMFNKLMYLMLFCTLEANSITRKAIIYIFKMIFETITSTPNVISNWINKQHLRYTKRNDAKPVMVVENSLKIFVQASICGIKGATINLGDMVNDTQSWNINIKQDIL